MGEMHYAREIWGNAEMRRKLRERRRRGAMEQRESSHGSLDEKNMVATGVVEEDEYEFHTPDM